MPGEFEWSQAEENAVFFPVDFVHRIYKYMTGNIHKSLPIDDNMKKHYSFTSNISLTDAFLCLIEFQRFNEYSIHATNG